MSSLRCIDGGQVVAGRVPRGAAAGRVRQRMVNGARFGIGRLGLRLACAFLLVALASIIVLSLLTETRTGPDIDAFIRHRELSQTRSVAVAAGALYEQPPVGWQRANLRPVVELIGRQGNSVQIRDRHGQVIAAGRGARPVADAPQYTVPIAVAGRRVGSVTMTYHSRGLGAAMRHLQSERRRASLDAAGIVALLAVAVSLLVSRQIASPLERVLAAIRARGSGDRSARVQDIPKAGVMHELGAALNEAIEAVDDRDRLRRDLVADIAHELRTPVAVLRVGHDAMLDGITQMNPENVQSLQEEVLRLARMIDDLQRLASAEAASVQLRLTPQDVSAVAGDAAASLAESFVAAGVSLERRLTPTPVICDPDRMREVIINLLTNARKFTPDGGSVVLGTSEKPSGEATLTVSDNGIGIPPEDLPRVAERFFRGKRSDAMADGTGIGLAIVAELVRAQHGRLHIESEPGAGTKVSITFRRSADRR